MVIRRRPLFYTVNLLLPSVFLMVMDIVGFFLPPDSGERVSFKITLLLGYSVFLIIVSDTLPATAIGTPLIGDWGSRSLEGVSIEPKDYLIISKEMQHHSEFVCKQYISKTSLLKQTVL